MGSISALGNPALDHFGKSVWHGECDGVPSRGSLKAYGLIMSLKTEGVASPLWSKFRSSGDRLSERICDKSKT
jgi:hypothetical protein